MIGLVLLIIADLLKWIIAPFAYIYGSIIALFKKDWNKYNTQLAISKDKYGNVLCQYIFNQLLITKDGYKFGNGNETVSSVLGKNKIKGTQTALGKILDKCLDLIDPNHTIKSIDNTVD